MSNELMVFEEHNVEVLVLGEQVLFNANDVGKALDIGNVRENLRTFSKNHVVKVKNSEVSNPDFRKLNNAGENFLTEAGVYRLAFSSRKEKAQEFTDWVTCKVLPSIRKTGSYSINQTQDTMTVPKHFIDSLIKDNNFFKSQLQTLDNKIDSILEQPLFKVYENTSYEYNKLMLEFFVIIKGDIPVINVLEPYVIFNREFAIWIGIEFGDKRINKKQYWLNVFGLNEIRHFIYGVKQGIIVKNSNGKWVDKNGYACNNVEWKRTLSEFGRKCAYCGDTECLTAEHIIPKIEEKSTDMIYNIIPACQRCNGSKNSSEINTWYTKQSFYSEDKMNKIRMHYKKYLI
jgi:prophage antirepressor-like protein